MRRTFYLACRAIARVIRLLSIRQTVLDPARLDLPSPCILACTHISHLEPFLIGTAVHPPVRWMARIEFYRRRWAGLILSAGGAFPVDRYGFSLPAVRAAIRFARNGEIVGIFPEGGVANGPRSVMRGGPIRLGACTVALATGVPIIPVVVLGAEHLNRVGPWLPFRRARIWLAIGDPIMPPPIARGESRRVARFALGAHLRAAFVTTYEDLLRAEHLNPKDFA
ncbi:lysophospholipid acyltransferase family protein [soil metagenome]